MSRPRPEPDRDSAPWWASLAEHRLVLPRCEDCGRWRWPPRALCNGCGSFDFRWAGVSGRATVASWVVNHHDFSPAFASPYTVVTARLVEQDDLLLVGSFDGPVEVLDVGLALEAGFEDVTGDGDDPRPVTLLRWHPSRPETTS